MKQMESTQRIFMVITVHH